MASGRGIARGLFVSLAIAPTDVFPCREIEQDRFQKLDVIWSCRPNNKPDIAVDVLPPPSAAVALLLPVDETATGSASVSDDEVISDRP